MDTHGKTAELPMPVREVNSKIKGWIQRLGVVWVEGQLTQVNVKPSWSLSYLTLRDTEEEASVQLTCPTNLLMSAAVPLKAGDRVVVQGKPAFYERRGSFSLWTTAIRHVGLGQLLERIERLRAQLASEGLTDPSRKRPLPFLPHRIGLITGRGSAAERDVLSVARRRWPEVSFRVINTAVQGAQAAPEVIAALETLDADPTVDVIIIARGGGSVEDLLPFSEERLQRAVVAARTPIVSAIGHEPDHPVLDDVADVRAATPTDAAKTVVPDVAQELQRVRELRGRTAGALRSWLEHQRRGVRDLRSRPVLSDPWALVRLRHDDVERALSQLRRDIRQSLNTHSQHIAGLRASVSALGPAATLARGYAVVQNVPRDGSSPEVVTSIAQAPPGTQLRIRVTDGSITAAGIATAPAP